ncbi:MAG: rod shape-determining protein RodA [Candidatus Buchananbacteria bacterium]|nr:rod shape-determining protein RodA [Candidatus Buchananbacteria bacterium]
MNRFSYLLTELKRLDWLLIGAVVLLVCFGLAAIYSVALGQGQQQFGNFQKQLIWLLLGLVVMLVIAQIDYHVWRRVSWILYGVALVLLLLVLTPLGATIRGTRGWFALGPVSFQPVEAAKITMLMVLAFLSSRFGRSIYKLWQLGLLGVVAFIPFAFVMLQPDFGSGMVLFFVWLAIFLLLVKKKWHIAFVAGTLVVSFAFAWFFVFADFQQARILTFINPDLDPLGRGYNVRQSIIAVGAGRLFGRGLGFGSQSQLKFIPESQTDFIFAVIAEELGLIGVMLVVGLFAFVLYRLYRIAARAPDDFGMFLVLLIGVLLFVQVFINIGFCVGLLPVTGISLPLVSYGGSFLLTIMALMGIVQSVHRQAVVGRRE